MEKKIKMKSKLIIEMDDREPNLQLLADVNDMNIEFDRKRLKVGDYIYKKILVERKTIDDLCASILDKRIETQVKMMKDFDGECFIVIVGNLKNRSTDIHENCILGKMVSLVVKHHIKVLWCENEFQFLYILKNLIEKVENEMS